AELKMTQELIESMEETNFEADQFSDTYAEAVQKMIERKLEGKQVKGSKAKPRQATNVLDLMSRLKASLEEAEKEEKKSTGKSTSSAKKSTSQKSTKGTKRQLKKAA